MTDMIVAIDGPAGSGKSSVSKATAARLGFDYLDTGAAYRALAWFALASSRDTADSQQVISLLVDFDYEIGTNPGEYFVRVGEDDVTEAIREPRVTAVVSDIARVPEVRAFVTELFRSIIRSSPAAGIIVEGRDITTVVAPDAPVRILLTASPEARMARRAAEVTTQTAEDVAAQLHKRDSADSRVVDFMTAAPGVTTLDSTDLDFEGTVRAVVDVINGGTPPNKEKNHG
jgi:cytidylate kinase